MPTRAWMSWSSGKDSAFALAAVRRDPSVEVVGLLTTMNAAVDRVSMHAVRGELLLAQADRLGLPVELVELPAQCPNDVYQTQMTAAIAAARRGGVEAVVFGDLFLRDVRTYREESLAGTGVRPCFPLWGRPTDALARDMLAAGVHAVITCVDPSQASPELAGRVWDERLLAELPSAVDPCGEHGEFHTFVWDAPGFRAPVPIDVGEVLERDGFVYCDVTPGE